MRWLICPVSALCDVCRLELLMGEVERERAALTTATQQLDKDR
jgi:hypothetical protein